MQSQINSKREPKFHRPRSLLGHVRKTYYVPKAHAKAIEEEARKRKVSEAEVVREIFEEVYG